MRGCIDQLVHVLLAEMAAFLIGFEILTSWSAIAAAIDPVSKAGNVAGPREQATLVLRVTGGANQTSSGTPVAGLKCATLSATGAGGVSIRTISVGVHDENGASGGNPADLSGWAADYFFGTFGSDSPMPEPRASRNR